MVERSTPAISMSLSRRPLMSTRLLAVANAPNPRRSTVVPTPFTPPKSDVSWTPGVCAMISWIDWVGECAISSAVMTDVDAPTMPANCRIVVALPVDETFGLFAGAPPGLLVWETFGATRREPEPSSLTGFARVRFWSPGGLTSIGGSRSEDICCAFAAEIPRERTGTRKLEASRQVRRRCAALRVEDMVRPRYDVSGTSQRTKSHHCALRTSVKLMSVLPDRHLRV